MDVIIILLLSFLALPLLAVSFMHAGAKLHLFGPMGDGPLTLAALAAQETGLLWLTLASVKWGYGRSWERIGLTGKRLVQEAGLGLLFFVPLYLIQEAAMWLSLRGFQLLWPASEVARLLAEENAALAGLVGQVRPLAPVFASILVFLAPLAEEVFFRGFLQEVFRERLGTLRAVVFAALLFALIHRYTVQFLPVFLIGLLLSLLYEWRRSLTAGVIAHAALNLTALLQVLKDLP
ncbi:MAG: lysostaphin resistance A-like protein [Betaproteobacteria bacterium]